MNTAKKSRPTRFMAGFSIACLLALTACGGDGQANSDASTQVNGFVSKAPLSYASCNLYNAANQVVAPLATSSAGKFDFGTTTATGAVYVSCSGGEYLDETTGQKVANTETLSGGTVIVAGNTATIIITPLTTLAWKMSGGDSARFATNAKTVAQAFGLGDVDIAAITPTDLNTAAASNDAAGRYGIVLAGIAQLQKNQGANAKLGDVLSLLHNAISTNASGTGQLNSAVASQMAAAITALTDPAQNSNAAVQTNSKNTSTSVATAILAGSGGTKSVTLTAASPSSLIQGAKGNNNMTLTGTGLYTGMPVKLGGNACTGGTANATATSLTGVDCSGVTVSATASSATLTAGTASLSGGIALTVAPAPTLTPAAAATVQIGGTLPSAAATSNSSGAITYAITAGTALAVNSSTGALSWAASPAAGSVTITATQAAVAGLYAAATATTTITVSDRTVPTLAFADASKTVTLGDADFSNVATAACSTGGSSYAPSVTYSVTSGATLATLDSAGKVILNGAGSATIQASISASGTCAAQTNSYTLTINKATPSVTFNSPTTTASFGGAALSGNTATVAAPTNNGTGTMPATTGLTLSYVSSNTAVATVTDAGVVTIVGVGTSNINVNTTADSNYSATTGSTTGTTTAGGYTLTVAKATPTLAMTSELSMTTTHTAGKANAATLTGVTGATAPSGSVTYSSSNEAIATVDAAGLVKPVAVGDATITAKYLGDANYNAATDVTTAVTVALPRFIKISSTGTELAASATEWCAVKDIQTNLMWENKTASNGATMYTNFDSYAPSNKQKDNVTDATQAEVEATTNSVGFMNAQNTGKLCSFSDWRLPTVVWQNNPAGELVELYAAYNTSQANMDYFPNTQSGSYWSSLIFAFRREIAFFVDFYDGRVFADNRSQAFSVRLVRASQ